MSRAKVIQFGCGPIGCSIVRYARERPDIELVGAIDVDASLVGRDLGDVAGIDGELGVRVSADADAVLSDVKADIVSLATASSVKAVHPQVAKCIGAGVNVLSTCEELSYPYDREPGLSAEMDRMARAGGVTVLATGVNPGFVMDAWPLFMTGVCQQVRQVRGMRVQDASNRRGSSDRGGLLPGGE